jgi:hypothetical protein
LDRVQGSESVHDASAVNSIPITDLRMAHLRRFGVTCGC